MSRSRYKHTIHGYTAPRRKEGTVPNNLALDTLLLLAIFIVELVYVVHVW